MNHKPIIIVQGAQWGSEAKGMVAAALCERRGVNYAVRTGAINAGHTVYYKGKRYVNQQLPTGWVSGCDLVLGAGALIHPPTLEREIQMVRDAGYKGLIFIDYRAGLHLDEHTDKAKMSGQHYRIGATGKGCSHALIDRIRRGTESKLFFEWCAAHVNHKLVTDKTFLWADTAAQLNRAYDRGDQILLEGTQGTLLDLYLGPYPYTTHKQCTAAQWVVEAGLSPSLDYEVVLVARTYPIRVAGNSGPMPNEIDWPTLARKINAKLPVPLIDPAAIEAFEGAVNRQTPYPSSDIDKSERNRDALLTLPFSIRDELGKLFEFTTVTKKLRRVARLDIASLRESVMLNRPAWMCLTFLNYEFPQFWGLECNGKPHIRVDADAPVWVEYLDDLQGSIDCPIRAVTTGPESKHYHDLYDTR